MVSTYIQFLAFIYTLYIVGNDWKTSDKSSRMIWVIYLTIFGLMSTIAVLWLYTDFYTTTLYIVDDYLYIFWIITNTYIINKKLLHKKAPNKK